MSPLNTRLFKDKDSYELLIASVESDLTDYYKSKNVEPPAYAKEMQKDGKTLTVKYGDFPAFMKEVMDEIAKAKEFAADANQAEMCQNYVEHFKYGDVNVHKDSQRNWIKDVGPVVETNIGFIETYLDPLGVRAEFEGFVAIVDKIIS